MNHKQIASAALSLATCLYTFAAHAQTDPKFAFEKPPEPIKKVEWASQVKGGLLLVSGNAKATTASLSGTASRKAGDNKLSIDVAAAYGEARNRVFNPAGGGSPTTIDSDADVTRNKETSTNNALARGRYDRFFTEKNSAYALGNVGRDKIAGKKLFGGAQAGYSRLLLENEQHLLVSEIGYDFSYESYYGGPASVTIHSARIFLGEAFKLTSDTGLYGNVEALFNLNKETNALDASVTSVPMGTMFPDKGVGAFKDIRVNAKAGLTTTLWENLSFGFGVTLRYDQNPAPLNVPMTADTFRVFANELDVLIDASLIVTLL